VGSVAYRSQPQAPGWVDATLSLVVGWFVSAVAIYVLYIAANLVGAISQPYGSHAGAVNEWPYFDNGLWGLLANLAVILIALVLATAATSWRLRRKHTQVSDGRLAVVLFFCGGVPLATAGAPRGLFGFLVALVLVRHWVARHEDRLVPKYAAAVVAVLGSVVLSYGLLHPVWTMSVAPTLPGGKARSVVVGIHNAARVGITIDRIAAPLPFGPARPPRLHLAPGGTRDIMLSVPHGCGTAVVGIHTRYHIFSLALSETVPAKVPLGRSC
jgi:hypothetical protein